jgi:hypothetical protein
MTKEIREWQAWLGDHPTDFAGHLTLKKLLREYGEALNKQQEAEFKALGF